MQADNRIVIISRLRSVAGHLRAVTTMVDKGAACGEVLHQLNAVQGAVRVVERELLSEHLVESEKNHQRERLPKRAFSGYGSTYVAIPLDN